MLFGIESVGEMRAPTYVGLGRHAPFDPDVIRVPEPEPVGADQPEYEMTDMERAKQVMIRVAEHPDDEGFFDLALLSAEYLAAAIDDPPEQEGMLRQLVTGEFLDGKPMTKEQAMGAIASTFLGGLDTSRSAIAGICLLMAQQPELEARIP